MISPVSPLRWNLSHGDSAELSSCSAAEFVIELVKRLDVGYNQIRIGAVIYSNFAENRIFLNTEFNKTLLLQVGGDTDTSAFRCRQSEEKYC